MKIILLFIIFYSISMSTYGMGGVEQIIRDTPEMNKTCKYHISKYTQKIEKYNRIPPNKRKQIDKFKLNYYESQLKEWTNYCSKTSVEESK